MDEPFSSLDPAARRDLQDLVAELQRELRLTTVIVTHNVEEAAFLGRRILLLAAPPNRQPAIVENERAGAPGYREDARYAEVVQSLQTALASDAKPQRRQESQRKHET
jgi:ABC-type nitrate/sulfonate/bicarbonate transport system ATPase subunit